MVRLNNQNMIKSSFISGIHIEPGQDLARYEDMAGLWLWLGLGVISDSALVIIKYNMPICDVCCCIWLT